MLKEKFSKIYEENLFRGTVSRSGGGSDLIQTDIIRRKLPELVKEYSIRIFLDAPCGDWYWMKETDLGAENYIGVDIVEALVEKNRATYGNASTTFLCLNLVTDPLPEADLIFSRDCLVHLSYGDAMKVIANFKKTGAKYLLTTTYTGRTTNMSSAETDKFANDPLGPVLWQPLNLRLHPFCFPEPLLMINEGSSEGGGGYADKSLGLWLLSDIDVDL